MSEKEVDNPEEVAGPGPGLVPDNNIPVENGIPASDELSEAEMAEVNGGYVLYHNSSYIYNSSIFGSGGGYIIGPPRGQG